MCKADVTFSTLTPITSTQIRLHHIESDLVISLNSYRVYCSSSFCTDSTDAESRISMSSDDSNIILTSTSPSYDPLYVPSSFPSHLPSHEAVDMRVVNITKALLDVSGEVMWQYDSPQN